MNDKDLDILLKDYFKSETAPESTTKVIENALKNLNKK